MTANLRFDLRALELLPLQPYFQDQVSLTVTDGTVSVKGQAAVKGAPPATPQMNLNADIDVNDLATADRQRTSRSWAGGHSMSARCRSRRRRR